MEYLKLRKNRQMRINLTDNNIAQKNRNTYLRKDVEDLFPISNKTIDELCRENRHLLLLPHHLKKSRDKIEDMPVLTVENTGDPERVRLVTGNMMGFIGIGDVKLKIQSRFDEGRDDYLLHYMLQRVLSFNLFDLKHDSSPDHVFDFIMFMFPHFLNQAMQQGLYREYRRYEYDDAKVKGVIQVNKFIRQDIPFTGNISYSNRNYSCDNDMTQLIRHTIEYMKTRKYGQSVLHLDNETVENVSEIVHHTPSYESGERSKIIQKNLRPKVHPYYTAYQPLQSLCLQILSMEEVKYGEDEHEIYGILFDGAWLWEEYVNIVLKGMSFTHAENKEGTNGIHLFRDPLTGKQSGIRYPDFYKKDFILDAKYKRLGDYDKLSKVNRDDLHQLITYVSRLDATKGGFVVPLRRKQEKIPTAHLYNESSPSLSIFGIQIDKNSDTYEDFVKSMHRYENVFRNSLSLTTASD